MNEESILEDKRRGILATLRVTDAIILRFLVKHGEIDDFLFMGKESHFAFYRRTYCLKTASSSRESSSDFMTELKRESLNHRERESGISSPDAREEMFRCDIT